ncbi:C3a anaphylatoxin chemotactic receptor [Apodemus speciosus]|uniref:C3a anaphylatoxin chemotactic receptor n=1 Tax=Apodemus speciosus TaxID=105296 RepID=A0ABQ0EW47_APOSI
MESFAADTNSTDLHSRPLFQPQEIASMVILGLTCLLGLPGNGLVLWVAGVKMKTTVNTVWFLHLTLADFLCCLSLPFSLAHLILRGYWPYGLFLCKLIPSIIILNMFASVFLLTAISLDRCLMVHKPIWCQNHRNVRTAFAICGCVWVVAFVMCVPVFVYRDLFIMDNHSVCSYSFYSSRPFDYWEYMYNLNLSESNSPTASSGHLYPYNFPDDYVDQFTYGNHVPAPLMAITITRLVAGFLVPFFIMVTCYSLIVFRMRKTNFTTSRNKTFRVAVTVVTVFFICWTPYHIVGVLGLITDPQSSLGEAVMSWDHMSIALASANSCFNPFLYALLGKDFRKKARQSIKGILEAAFSEELTHSTSCTQDKVSSKRNMSTDV